MKLGLGNVQLLIQYSILPPDYGLDKRLPSLIRRDRVIRRGGRGESRWQIIGILGVVACEAPDRLAKLVYMTKRIGWRAVIKLRTGLARRRPAGLSVRAPRQAIAVALTIDRPFDLVRAHFFDVDHQVRTNVFQGLRMAHLPSQTPGERRVRQEVMVAGIPQISVFVVEEGPDGEYVRRFVHGRLRGIEWRVRFSAENDQRTRVEASATVSAAGLRRLAVPVRRRSLKRALETALKAHKDDLEVRGYPPPARR